MSQVRLSSGGEPDQDAVPAGQDPIGDTAVADPPQERAESMSGRHAPAAVVPIVTAPPVAPSPQPAVVSWQMPHVSAEPQGYAQQGFAPPSPSYPPAAWPQPRQQPSWPAPSWPAPSWAQQDQWQQTSAHTAQPAPQQQIAASWPPQSSPQSWPQPLPQQPVPQPVAPQGYDLSPYQGYAQPSYPQPTDWQSSYPPAPYPQPAYAPAPYPPPPVASPQVGYPQQAYPQPAYPQPAYPQPAYAPAPPSPVPPTAPSVVRAPSPEQQGQTGTPGAVETGPVVEADEVRAPEPQGVAHAANAANAANAAPRMLAYEVGQEERRSPAWKVIKWPLRHLIKALYLGGNAANNHRKTAIILTVLVLFLALSGYGVYTYTHPPVTATGASADATGGIGTSQDTTTPFTVVTGSQPPLAPGVIQWLHAYKTFNGYELWDSLSPGFQQQLTTSGIKSDQLQQALLQEKDQGVGFDEFIYTGGYLSPDGLSHFTVEAVETQGDKKAILTWFFMTDSNGKIVMFRDLSPNSQG